MRKRSSDISLMAIGLKLGASFDVRLMAIRLESANLVPPLVALDIGLVTVGLKLRTLLDVRLVTIRLGQYARDHPNLVL